MGSHLELLAAVLILVGRTENGYYLLLGWKGDGAGNACAGPLGRFHDLTGALVDKIVFVGLQLDTNLLICHVIFLLLVCGLYTRPSVSFLKCFSRAHRPVARIVGALRKLPGWHNRQPPAKA